MNAAPTSRRLTDQPEIFWVAVAAAGVMVLSLIAPWAKAGVLASASGIERDVGVLYLLLGAGALGALYGFASTRSQPLLLLAAAAAVVGLVVSSLDARDLENDEGVELFGERLDVVEVAWGLRAYQIAAFALAVLAFMHFRSERKTDG